MKHIGLFISSLTFLWFVLYACNSETSNDNNKAATDILQNEIPELADSLIPESVNLLVNQLETVEVKTLLISSSKWNLFEKQGIWVKTNKGIIDIIPIPDEIDNLKLKITVLPTDSITYNYELTYNDTLLQIIQGKETFFAIGDQYICKSLEEPLMKVIKEIENARK